MTTRYKEEDKVRVTRDNASIEPSAIDKGAVGEVDWVKNPESSSPTYFISTGKLYAGFKASDLELVKRRDTNYWGKVSEQSSAFSDTHIWENSKTGVRLKVLDHRNYSDELIGYKVTVTSDSSEPMATVVDEKPEAFGLAQKLREDNLYTEDVDQFDMPEGYSFDYYKRS